MEITIETAANAIAVVNFRVMPNGAYSYMRGLRRGYYRMQVLRDRSGPTSVNSRNVASQIASGEGIEGVTERSKYDLSYARAYLQKKAHEVNHSIVNALIALAAEEA